MATHALFGDVLLETTVAERRRRRFTLFATLSGEALVIAALVAVPLLYLDAVPGSSVHAAPQPIVSFTRPIEIVDSSHGPASSGHSVSLVRRTDEYVVTRTNSNPTLTYDRYRPPSDDLTTDPRLANAGPCCGNSILSQVIGTPPVHVQQQQPRKLLISHLDEGMIIRRVEPVYPSTARLARVQGDVVLRAMISKDGNIEGLQVVSGNPLLAPAAANAVSQWRFRPYQLNGSPIGVEAQITVRFVLGNN